MQSEKKPLISVPRTEFTAFPENINAENVFPLRDENNEKIELTDLFMHFTASVIQQDVSFTR